MNEELEVEATLAALCASLRERDATWDELSEEGRDAAELVVERRAAGDDEASIERARALYEPVAEATRESLFAMLEPGQVGAAAPRARGERASNAGVAAGLGRSIAAAAAALFIVLALQPTPTPTPAPAPRVARALPDFTLSTDSGGASSRDGAPRERQILRYVATNRFDWLLRPAEPVEGALELGICAQAEHARPRLISASSLVEAAPSGAQRLRGSIAELGLEPGLWSLVFGVRAGTGRAFGVDLCTAEDSAGLRLRRLELRVD